MNKKEIESLIKIGENKVEFAQTSKGVWYCTGFIVFTNSIMDSLPLCEKAMVDINSILKKINENHVDQG